MQVKILVADDSATDRMLIKNMLSDCCILTACDGVDDMSTLFWTYLNRTIYLMVYEFIVNNKIAFLALSRVK